MMKTIKLDKNLVEKEIKEYWSKIAVCLSISFFVCLFLFLLHTRNNTIIIFPIVLVVSVSSVCYFLYTYLNPIKYLKQYLQIVKKAENHHLCKNLKLLSYSLETFRRDNLYFNKVLFVDENNKEIELLALSPNEIKDDLKERNVKACYVDNILLSLECIYE